jgi:hypothetical protein
VVPPKPPVSDGLVHDFAGILTDEQERSLGASVAYDSTSARLPLRCPH